MARNPSVTPIVALGDDDKDALTRLADLLEFHFEVLARDTWPLLRRTVEVFATDAVLLADTLTYPKNTTEKMLGRLYSEYGAKVIILSESVTPESRARWRELGAVDCLPHPTKSKARGQAIFNRILEIVATRHPVAEG